ncbi:MAG: hypothetical protein ACXWR4_18525, partial [Bdellovibrionota bacterium]
QAEAHATGILRVNGQPGNLQPSKVFLMKCDTDAAGKLVKYTCGKHGDYWRLSEGVLNQDTPLAEGTYALSYDNDGSNSLVKIKEGETTTVQLEQVDFPADAKPADIRVILDLTDPQEVAHYLSSMYAIDVMEQYNYERPSAPKTPENEAFFTVMENAQGAEDLLNVAVRFDANGIPAFWNLWHGFVKSTGSCATACLWAGETGHFVAVLPGSVYSVIDWSKGSDSPVYHHGVHSRPQ